MNAVNTCAACTGCRDNFALPTADNIFDEWVVADYVKRRTACTAVPDAAKPCLQPAPAAFASTQTESPDMAAKETFPYANGFDPMGSDSAVYLCPRSVDRLNAAVQGIHTLTAMLVQRELDADVDLTTPCKFGPNVAMGILSAIACCAEVASAAADGRIFPMAVRVDSDSAAHKHMEQAAMQAGRMARGQE